MLAEEARAEKASRDIPTWKGVISMFRVTSFVTRPDKDKDKDRQGREGIMFRTLQSIYVHTSSVH